MSSDTIFNEDGSLTNAFKSKVPAVFEPSYGPKGVTYKVRMDIVRESLNEMMEKGERRRSEAHNLTITAPLPRG